MQSQIVQDLSSHVMALRQRGCEKLRDFVASNDDQTIENMFSEDLVRRVASVVTDVSPLASVAAMDALDAFLSRPTDRFALSASTAISFLIDALVTRLADAKVPIRTKARAVMTSLISKVDVSMVIYKLNALRVSRNVHLRRHLGEMTLEILSTTNPDVLQACEKEIAGLIVSFASEYSANGNDSTTVEITLPCLEVAQSKLGANFQTALKEAGLRADVQQKLFLKLSSSSNHTVNNDNVPRKALSIDTKANAVARSQNSSVQPSPATSVHTSGTPQQQAQASTTNSSLVSEILSLPSLTTFVMENLSDNSATTTAKTATNNFTAMNTNKQLVLRQDADLLSYIDSLARDLEIPGSTASSSSAAAAHKQASSHKQSISVSSTHSANNNKEDDWQRRQQALLSLQAVTWGSVHNQMKLATWQAMLRKLQDQMDAQLGDLRSSITKEACRALAILAVQVHRSPNPIQAANTNGYSEPPSAKATAGLSAAFVSFLDFLWPRLSKLLVSKIQIMCCTAEWALKICLLSLSNNASNTTSAATSAEGASASSSRVFNWMVELLRVLSASSDDSHSKYFIPKHGSQRKVGLESFLLLSARWPADILDRGSPYLQSALRIGLVDAQADCRRLARCLYRLATVYAAPSAGKTNNAALRNVFAHLLSRVEHDLEAATLKQLQQSSATNHEELEMAYQLLPWRDLVFSDHLSLTASTVASNKEPESQEQGKDYETRVDTAAMHVTSASTAPTSQSLSLDVFEDDHDWLAAACDEDDVDKASARPAASMAPAQRLVAPISSISTTSTTPAINLTGLPLNVSSSSSSTAPVRRRSLSAAPARPTTSSSVSASSSTVLADGALDTTQTLSLLRPARRLSMMSQHLSATSFLQSLDITPANMLTSNTSTIATVTAPSSNNTNAFAAHNSAPNGSLISGQEVSATVSTASTSVSMRRMSMSALSAGAKRPVMISNPVVNAAPHSITTANSAHPAAANLADVHPVSLEKEPVLEVESEQVQKEVEEDAEEESKEEEKETVVASSTTSNVAITTGARNATATSSTSSIVSSAKPSQRGPTAAFTTATNKVNRGTNSSTSTSTSVVTSSRLVTSTKFSTTSATSSASLTTSSRVPRKAISASTSLTSSSTTSSVTATIKPAATSTSTASTQNTRSKTLPAKLSSTRMTTASSRPTTATSNASTGAASINVDVSTSNVASASEPLSAALDVVLSEEEESVGVVAATASTDDDQDAVAQEDKEVAPSSASSSSCLDAIVLRTCMSPSILALQPQARCEDVEGEVEGAVEDKEEEREEGKEEQSAQTSPAKTTAVDAPSSSTKPNPSSLETVVTSLLTSLRSPAVSTTPSAAPPAAPLSAPPSSARVLFQEENEVVDRTENALKNDVRESIPTLPQLLRSLVHLLPKDMDEDNTHTLRLQQHAIRQHVRDSLRAMTEGDDRDEEVSVSLLQSLYTCYRHVVARQTTSAAVPSAEKNGAQASTSPAEEIATWLVQQAAHVLKAVCAQSVANQEALHGLTKLVDALLSLSASAISSSSSAGEKTLSQHEAEIVDKENCVNVSVRVSSPSPLKKSTLGSKTTDETCQLFMLPLLQNLVVYTAATTIPTATLPQTPHSPGRRGVDNHVGFQRVVQAIWPKVLQYLVSNGVAHAALKVRQQSTVLMARMYVSWVDGVAGDHVDIVGDKADLTEQARQQQRSRSFLQHVAALTPVQRKLLRVYVLKLQGDASNTNNNNSNRHLQGTAQNATQNVPVVATVF